MDCAKFNELVGLLALGAIHGDELAEVQAHLAEPIHDGCQEALVVAMQGASVLDGAGPVVGPGPHVWRKIADKIASDVVRRRRGKRTAVLGWAVAACAASLALYLALRPPGREALLTALDGARRENEARTASLTTAMAQRETCNKQLEALKDADLVRGEAVALLRLAGTQLFPLRAEKGQVATANAILHTGLKRAYVVADGLRPIADHDYELWVARGKKVVAAGVVHVDAQGRTVVRVDYEALLGDASLPDAMMITLEPAGGSTDAPGPTVVIGAMHG